MAKGHPYYFKDSQPQSAPTLTQSTRTTGRHGAMQCVEWAGGWVDGWVLGEAGGRPPLPNPKKGRVHHPPTHHQHKKAKAHTRATRCALGVQQARGGGPGGARGRAGVGAWPNRTPSLNQKEGVSKGERAQGPPASHPWRASPRTVARRVGGTAAACGGLARAWWGAWGGAHGGGVGSV